MALKRILLIFGIAATLSSCSSKMLFTHDLRLKLEKAGIGLNEIQYYNAHELNLYSQERTDNMSVEDGKIKLASGNDIEEVRIKTETPGVCTGSTGDKMMVAFEQGDGKALTFFKNSYGKYQIFAEDWVKSRYGKITYDGKPFYIQPEGNQTLLLVKKSQINKVTREGRTAKGVKVGG